MMMKSNKPNWDHLYEFASAQDGHFTTAQAAESGYSPQLLAKYMQNGRIQRIRRGIYRLVHFPAGEYEDLVVFWLWSEQMGVFSHETALFLHGLSDILAGQIHMTLPAPWKLRRFRIPQRLILYFNELSEEEYTWSGNVPVTTPTRTLCDCADAALSPELLQQAVNEGLARGLFARSEIAGVISFLAPFEEVVR